MQLYGTVAMITGGFGAINNIKSKAEPSLMFVSEKRGNEIQIFQNYKPEISSKMKDYSMAEKAGMMALQTLVGFSRYKENFKYADYEIGENGEKIYNKTISTVTHGVNIKTLQAIEKLGYIKIDSIDEKFKQTVIEKAIGKEARGLETLLIVEKLGFKNYKDLEKIGKAKLKQVRGKLTRNKEEVEENEKILQSMKKKFNKISFRLTDKKIDFEELYEKSADYSKLEKDERMALKRLAIIFDNNNGILATKNIDISQDRFGRDIIQYDTSETFAKRLKRDKLIRKIEQRNIKQELKVNPEDLKENSEKEENGIRNEQIIEDEGLLYK